MDSEDTFRTDGKFIIVFGQEVEFPPNCIICAQAADKRVKRTFEKVPWWRLLVIFFLKPLVGIFGWKAIGLLSVTDYELTVHYTLCDKHNIPKWRERIEILFVLSMVLLLCAIPVALGYEFLDENYWDVINVIMTVIFALIGLSIFYIIAIFINSKISGARTGPNLNIKHYEDGKYYLTGAGKPFLDSVEKGSFPQLGDKPLPIELLQDEKILLEEKAVHRFGLLGVHLDCRVIVTDKRLVFQDKNKAKDSFEISIDELRQAELERIFGKDLAITLSSGSKYEIGLEEGQWQQIVDLIENMINK